jgi:hypothetical protein
MAVHVLLLVDPAVVPEKLVLCHFGALGEREGGGGGGGGDPKKRKMEYEFKLLATGDRPMATGSWSLTAGY